MGKEMESNREYLPISSIIMGISRLLIFSYLDIGYPYIIQNIMGISPNIQYNNRNISHNIMGKRGRREGE